MLTRFLLTPWLGNAREEGVGEVAEEELVHGHVPEAPVLREVLAVPPVLVELAVAEAQQLAGDVVEVVEERDEPGDPDDDEGQGEAEQLLRLRS